jgi:hypothetical protein
MDDKEGHFLAYNVMTCYLYVYWREEEQPSLAPILGMPPSTFDRLSNSTSNLTDKVTIRPMQA